MNRHVLLTTMILCAGSCICLAGSVNVTHIADVGVKCNAVDLITIEQHRYVLADTFLINVDNPQKPIAKPSFMFSNVDHVKAVGKHAYVAANLGSLQVLDISNADDVKVAGQYKPEGAHLNTGAFCVDVHGKYAYVTFAGYGQSEYYGLYILDISNPPKPSKVGHYAAPGWFSDVVVSGDHAYLTIVKSGLHIIDINEPSNPKLVGSCKLPGNAGGVALAGKHCLVTVYDKGLAVVDVSDVTRPTLTTTCEMAGHPKKVTVSGNLAFVAAQRGGMHILDIESISKPKVLVSHPTRMVSLDVAVSGDYVFIANLLGGLEITRVERQ